MVIHNYGMVSSQLNFALFFCLHPSLSWPQKSGPKEGAWPRLAEPSLNDLDRPGLGPAWPRPRNEPDLGPKNQIFRPSLNDLDTNIFNTLDFTR